MIGSRRPIFVATFSTTSGGAIPPTIRRTGSPGTTRSSVKMMNEVMQTIRNPCAIRLRRNSRINIGSPDRQRKGEVAGGERAPAWLFVRRSDQRCLGHVLHSVGVDVEPLQLLAVSVNEYRREQRQRRRLLGDGRQRFGLQHLLALFERGGVAFLVEHCVDF